MLYEFEFYFNPWALIHALGKIDGERQLLRIGKNSVYYIYCRVSVILSMLPIRVIL